MIKHYETLEMLLDDCKFDIDNSVLADGYIMTDDINDKTYICKINQDDEGYYIDNCKYFKSRGQGILTMIKIIAEQDDEIK